MSKCVIIVGAGIAGMYTAVKLVDDGYNVIILEKADRVGGRLYTKYYKGYHIETGAYRVSEGHNLVVEACKRFGVEVKPASFDAEFRPSYTGFKPIPNPENELIKQLYATASQLSYDDAIDLTPLRVMTRFYGAEKAILYADSNGFTKNQYETSAYNMLQQGVELTTFNDWKFYMPVAGVTDLVSKISHYLMSTKKCKIIQDEVVWIDHKNIVVGKSGQHYEGACVVLTLPKRKLMGLYDWNAQELRILNGVSETRYMKVIANFPCAWFKGLGSIVTDTIITKFSPINEEHGVVLLSYNNGIKARHLRKIHKRNPQLAISILMRDLRDLIPEKTIPDPTCVEFYYKGDILHNWKPGVDVVQFERQLDDIGRNKSLFIVGEAYSGGSWSNLALQTVERRYPLMKEKL